MDTSKLNNHREKLFESIINSRINPSPKISKRNLTVNTDNASYLQKNHQTKQFKIEFKFRDFFIS